jgi:hypothetical protein
MKLIRSHLTHIETGIVYRCEKAVMLEDGTLELGRVDRIDVGDTVLESELAAHVDTELE